MTSTMITPPVAMMATALRCEISQWYETAMALVPEAYADYQRQVKEQQEIAQEIAEFKRETPRFVPKDFLYTELTQEFFKISFVGAVEIISTMCQCWIATRSVFEKADYSRIDEVLIKQLMWYRGVGVNSDIIASTFYAEVIDPVFIQIHEMLESFIAENTWDVWSVVPINRSQFTIKNDGDYRVLEWEQLVADGVVNCPVRSQLKAPRAPDIRSVVIKDLPSADWTNAADDTGSRVNPIPKGSIHAILQDHQLGED